MKSMTGYGRAAASVEGRDITVEIRAVNHRYFDCTVKAGRLYGYLEDPVKKAIQARVSRGKLDVFVTVDNSQSDDVEVVLNQHVFEAYLHSMKEMCRIYGLKDDISVTAVSRYPEVFTVVDKQADADALTRDVLEVTAAAVEDFERMRLREGQKMREDVEGYLTQIENLVAEIGKLAPQTVAAYREKLDARIRELLEGAQPDETRLLTEVAIFADRVAIDEELARLGSHIAQARGMLASGEAVGRKLDFLIQEFNRECNTIGSKCNDVEITRIVVDLKSIIEKIREQIQNIE